MTTKQVIIVTRQLPDSPHEYKQPEEIVAVFAARHHGAVKRWIADQEKLDCNKGYEFYSEKWPIRGAP